MTKKIDVSAGAMLMLAALWFFCGWELFASIIAASAVHEAGHLLALRASGARITGFRAGFGELVIDCAGATGAFGQALSAAAGPVFGALLALAAAWAGSTCGSAFLLCLSGTSAALTAVNLVPALPLDGGRIVEAAAGARAAEALGLAASVAAAALGLVLAREGYGWGVFVLGAWLMVFQAGL